MEAQKQKNDVTYLALNKIKADENLQIRRIRSSNVKKILSALETGRKLKDPVLVLDKKKRIVCGWHRYTAYTKYYGKDHQVPVLIMDFKSDDEARLYAADDNDTNGLQLEDMELRRLYLDLKSRGVDDNTIISAVPSIGWRLENFKIDTAYVNTGEGKQKVVPLKRSTRHLRGKELTKDQAEWETKHNQGWPFYFHADQMIGKIKNELVDPREDNIATAEKLIAVLQEWVNAVKKRK